MAQHWSLFAEPVLGAFFFTHYQREVVLFFAVYIFSPLCGHIVAGLGVALSPLCLLIFLVCSRPFDLCFTKWKKFSKRHPPLLCKMTSPVNNKSLNWPLMATVKNNRICAPGFILMPSNGIPVSLALHESHATTRIPTPFNPTDISC